VAVTTVDNDAPVKGSVEIEIDADPETVWELLTTIDDWPNWNPDVRSASLEGPLDEGSQFRWKVGAPTITATLETVDRPRRFAWRARAMGIHTVHVYRLETLGAKTIVTSEESWDGLPCYFFRRKMQRTMDGAARAGMRSLKAAAELNRPRRH
jgi:uncharacterized protein YndB with AHSA1/START domain